MSFENQKFGGFLEIWQLLFTTLAFKQSANNIVETVKPLITVDWPVRGLKEEYRNVIALYNPDEALKIKTTKDAISKEEV